MTSKPSIIIVPGAWHVPKSYSKINKALESAGFVVHIPDLPTMNGSRPPNADMYSDAAAIHTCAEKLADAGKIVIALLHSYGGQPATEGLSGLG
jgi:dienelactone hydrolase